MRLRSASLTLISILAAALMTRCSTAAAKAALGGNTDQAAICAATTLSSLGYYVEERVDGEPLHAQRQKHAIGPINGAMDADRITVFLSEAPAGHEGTMRVFGETVHSGLPRMAPATRPTRGIEVSDTPTRTWVSSEVRGDVQKLAGECGAGATPK